MSEEIKRYESMIRVLRNGKYRNERDKKRCLEIAEELEKQKSELCEKLE